MGCGATKTQGDEPARPTHDTEGRQEGPLQDVTPENNDTPAPEATAGEGQKGEQPEAVALAEEAGDGKPSSAAAAATAPSAGIAASGSASELRSDKQAPQEASSMQEDADERSQQAQASSERGIITEQSEVQEEAPSSGEQQSGRGVADSQVSPRAPPKEAVLACMRDAYTRLQEVVAERKERGMPTHSNEDPSILFQFLGEAMQIGTRHGVKNILGVKQMYADDEECAAEWTKLEEACQQHGLPTGV